MPVTATPFSDKSTLDLTSEIVSAYVRTNPVPLGEVSNFIKSIHATLAGLGVGGAAPEALKPAVPVKKSIYPDYVVCLEDGKRLKMLKRYLRTRHNLTPEQYRTKWGLSADYPMVAPNYAAMRSKVAKDLGLGTTGNKRRAKKASR